MHPYNMLSVGGLPLGVGLWSLGEGGEEGLWGLVFGLWGEVF